MSRKWKTLVLPTMVLFAVGGIASGVIYGYDQLPSRYGGGFPYAIDPFPEN